MDDTVKEAKTTGRRPLAHRSAIVAELQAHASAIRAQGVTSLALFGSRARGEERADSDLDVLIDYDSDRPFTLYDLARVERLLARLTGLKVHVATSDAFRPHRLRRATKDAISVF